MIEGKTERPPLLRYGAALLASALSILLSLAAYSFFEPIPFVLFFAPVAFSAWYGGLGPGLLATGIRAVPHLRNTVTKMADGAQDAARVLEQIRQITRIKEAQWGGTLRDHRPG